MLDIKARAYYFLNLYPRKMMIDLSSKCNAACPFCTRTVLDIKDGVNIDEDLFCRVVDQAWALGVRMCRLYSTGEPLLHPRVDALIRHAKKKRGFTVGISTNGQLLDRHFEALSELDFVKYSMEGWDRESYEHYRKNCSYDVIRENVTNFKKYISNKKKKPMTVIMMLVNRETDVAAFDKEWRHKVDRIDYAFVKTPETWRNGHLVPVPIQDERCRKHLYGVKEISGTKYCNYPFDQVVVSPKGNVVICCQDYENSIVLGNLKEMSLKEVMKSGVRKSIQKQFVDQKFNICKGCSAFTVLDDESAQVFKSQMSVLENRSNEPIQYTEYMERQLT